MTTTYTFEQLKEDVRKEAEALRVHSTKEELGRLDFEQLDPKQNDRCIYGLATGSCMCKRAIELIRECAPIAFSTGSKKDALKPVGTYDASRWSPIELYITFPEANNESLIAYLRGETEMLEL